MYIWVFVQNLQFVFNMLLEFTFSVLPLVPSRAPFETSKEKLLDPNEKIDVLWHQYFYVKRC